MCVCLRLFENKSANVSVYESIRERENMCVFVCECLRKRVCVSELQRIESIRVFASVEESSVLESFRERVGVFVCLSVLQRVLSWRVFEGEWVFLYVCEC